ncbi:MAG: hypothetical protein NZ782_00650 [Candidatus Poseidoniia archaeon]|nr:hypothetical protein [Candidatus Poseidoniia archaeon]
MVRLINEQPDAFAYRLFGRRVMFTGLLVAAIYAAAGTIVLQESEAIMRQTGMDSEGLTGQITGAIVFVMIVFVPLAGSMMLLTQLLSRALGKLEVEQGLPLAMLTASRLVFIAAIIVALAPLGLAIDAPITAINFYQERFMTWFFTLVGIGLALALLAPVRQLQLRTGRLLWVPALAGAFAAGYLVWMAHSPAWDISVFQLSQENLDAVKEFRTSFTFTMLTCAAAIMTWSWTISRNASSILVRQKAHFFTQLGR